MKILLCNERFLFRFGVDRVLMILGVYFKKMGHEVIMMGNKLDEAAVKVCTDRFIQIPEAPVYIDSNEFAREWLEQNWDSLFLTEDDTPDIAFVAGWPFYMSLDFLDEKCGACVFHDYGAVDTKGMEGGALITQQKLKRLRNENLSKADKIIAISRFLEETQSKIDAKNMIPTSFVHLGIDHMKMNLWSNGVLSLEESKIMSKVKQLKDNEYKLIFSLGRFEVGNYKNSPQAFELLRSLKQRYSGKVKLLLLARESENVVPEDLIDDVLPLGFVSDDDLDALMGISDIGVCMSLWEGFNLPLAEMQLKERPVFVFDVGAHPEVVINPYYLCKNLDDMTEKIYNELTGNSKVSEAVRTADYNRFKSYFTWQNSAEKLMDELQDVLIKKRNLMVVMDVTNACHDTANTGVMRVTRHIARNLQSRCPMLFVLWDSSIQQYVLPYAEEVKCLASYGGPDEALVTVRSKEGEPRSLLNNTLNQYSNMQKYILITETINESTAYLLRKYAKENGMKTAAVFHDAIPVRFPEYCSTAVSDNHVLYMKGLAECDLILPNSDASKVDLLKFWQEENIPATTVSTDLLPGELEGIERTQEIVPDTTKTHTKMLCVSTLEPRKNHKRLLNACLMMAKEHPELDWELTLVGNRYAGNDEIPNFVNSVCKKERRIKWLGVVNDETLAKEYAEADFTVYPSLIEGFGMPIMESLWNGKPCLCSNQNVMSELARDGGCLTVDVTDERSIMDGMVSLISDKQLKNRLIEEAMTRHIRTWKDYTVTFIDRLLSLLDKHGAGKKHRSDCFFFYNKDYSKSDLTFGAKLALLQIFNGKYFDCAVCFGQTKNICLFANNIPVVYHIIEDDSSSYQNCYTLNQPPEQVLPLLKQELTHAGRKLSLFYIGREYTMKGFVKNWVESQHSSEPVVVIEECSHGSEKDMDIPTDSGLGGQTMEFEISSKEYDLKVFFYG